MLKPDSLPERLPEILPEKLPERVEAASEPLPPLPASRSPAVLPSRMAYSATAIITPRVLLKITLWRCWFMVSAPQENISFMSDG